MWQIKEVTQTACLDQCFHSLGGRGQFDEFTTVGAAAGYVRCGGPEEWQKEMSQLKKMEYRHPGRAQRNEWYANQRNPLRDYARENHLRLWRTFFDPEVDLDFAPRPLPLARRQELAKLALAVKVLGIRTVLVDNWKRLDDDKLVAAVLCDFFRSMGASVIQTGAKTDPKTELTSEGFLDQILNSAPVGDLHRARRAVGRWKALVTELKNSLHKDDWVPRGRKPFGFRPGEKETLDRLVQLYRRLPKWKRDPGGARKHRSLDDIADILNNEGRPSRSGKPWMRSGVRKILKRLGKLETRLTSKPFPANAPDVIERHREGENGRENETERATGAKVKTFTSLAVWRQESGESEKH